MNKPCPWAWEARWHSGGAPVIEDVIPQGLERGPPGQMGPAGASLAFRGQACLCLVVHPTPARKGLGWTHRISPSGGLQGLYRGWSSAGYRMPTCAGFRKRAMSDGSPYYTGSQRRSISATSGTPNPVTASVSWSSWVPSPYQSCQQKRRAVRTKSKRSSSAIQSSHADPEHHEEEK